MKLLRVVKEFVEHGTAGGWMTTHRGRGNPAHPLHSNNTDQYGPSFGAELLIHELVHTQKTECASITSTTIAAELRAKRGYRPSIVARFAAGSAQLGYRWRHKRYVGGMKPQAKNVRIRQFILEYAAALSRRGSWYRHHRVRGRVLHPRTTSPARRDGSIPATATSSAMPMASVSSSCTR